MGFDIELMGFHGIWEDLPFGDYGTSPFMTGKSTLNGLFSVAISYVELPGGSEI